MILIFLLGNYNSKYNNYSHNSNNNKKAGVVADSKKLKFQ
jgi:hypothetical protein